MCVGGRVATNLANRIVPRMDARPPPTLGTPTHVAVQVTCPRRHSANDAQSRAFLLSTWNIGVCVVGQLVHARAVTVYNQIDVEVNGSS